MWERHSEAELTNEKGAAMLEEMKFSGTAQFVITELDGRSLSTAGTGAEVNCGGAEVNCGGAEVNCGGAEVNCGGAEVNCGGAEVNCPGGLRG